MSDALAACYPFKLRQNGVAEVRCTSLRKLSLLRCAAASAESRAASSPSSPPALGAGSGAFASAVPGRQPSRDLLPQARSHRIIASSHRIASHQACRDCPGLELPRCLQWNGNSNPGQRHLGTLASLHSNATPEPNPEQSRHATPRQRNWNCMELELHFCGIGIAWNWN